MASKRKSLSRPRRRSSRPGREEDPLVRIHRVRRQMERRRKRLGLTLPEYVDFVLEKSGAAAALR